MYEELYPCEVRDTPIPAASLVGVSPIKNTAEAARIQELEHNVTKLRVALNDAQDTIKELQNVAGNRGSIQGDQKDTKSDA